MHRPLLAPPAALHDDAECRKVTEFSTSHTLFEAPVKRPFCDHELHARVLHGTPCNNGEIGRNDT